MTTEEIKLECLRLANNNSGHVGQHEMTVKAAEAFYAFATGAKKEAPKKKR